MLAKTRRGDTMIEVMFGVAIFGLVAVSTIGLMNSSLATAEVNIEETMARDEMNAQAEAIRFIHSSYASTDGSAYHDLWKAITERASEVINNNSITNVAGGTDCDDLYYGTGGVNPIATSSNSFAINTKAIKDATSTLISHDKLNPAETYPIVDHDQDSADGIWVNVIQGKKDDIVYYYDFYIRTCWYGIGSSTSTTLDTVIRLYNPDRRFS